MKKTLEQFLAEKKAYYEKKEADHKEWLAAMLVEATAAADADPKRAVYCYEKMPEVGLKPEALIPWHVYEGRCRNNWQAVWDGTKFYTFRPEITGKQLEEIPHIEHGGEKWDVFIPFREAHPAAAEKFAKDIFVHLPKP